MPLIPRLALAATLAAAWTAPVLGACSVALEPVTFGVIDTLRQNSGTGKVVVDCDAAATFEVAISPGRAAADTRRMTGPGGARLAYYLFSDAGHVTPWGDGQALGNPYRGAAGGGALRLTVYGIVPAQTGIAAGEYDDSLQVTLTF